MLVPASQHYLGPWETSKANEKGARRLQSNNAVACAVTRKEAEQSGGIQGAARSIGLALGTALAGTFLLLTMAGGFAAQAASAGIDQSYVAPAAETASTLMSDSAFSDEARTWGPTPRRSTSSWT